MIKTLNPYSATTAKTAEIMSRYRPIAPRPEAAAAANSMNEIESSSGMSQKMMQSPYLRNFWPRLQARPTRTRKRGRIASSVPPTLLKRARNGHELGLSSPAKNLSLNCFSLGIPHLSFPNFVTSSGGEKVIDLNTVAEIPEPEEKEKLQGPPTSTSTVIAPQPIRPIGSSISVVYFDENILSSLNPTVPQLLPKKLAEEVEAEFESEALPAVISDSNNKVRLANSAYKEMVGQPECAWIDSMVITGSGPQCKRICGEVMLHLSDSRVPLKSSNGFSCWVRIEWGSQGKKKKSSVNAFCDVIRLSCDHSKDYLFIWRFHTQNREASKSSSNV